MKYIRTKDGIYRGGEFYLDGLDENLKPTFKIKVRSTITENEIVKKADTIEELCDEFVIVWKDYEYKHCIWEDLKELKLSYKDWQFDEMENIFGAIWTEWGLKYVAKMNEKGELELL